jgi:hypothetical protein
MKMKKLSIFFVFTLIAVLLCDNLSAQSYARIKVNFINGTSIEGRNGYLDNKNVTLTINNRESGYSLDDVFYIQAKRGLAGKYALGFGGGCLALGLISTVTYSGDEFEQSDLLLGSLLWAGLFAAAGGLIGSLSDQWTEIYRQNPGSSLLNERLNLSLTSNKIAPVNIGIVYRFN